MGKGKPVVAVTMGDPAGIGPEVAVRAAAACREAEVVLHGDPAVLAEAAERFSGGRLPAVKAAGAGGGMEGFTPGVPSPETGLAAVAAVRAAVADALAGEADAVMTAPVCKSAIVRAGIPFSGHTEFIAELCGASSVAMRQSAGRLRVVFATTHIPLASVPAALTTERIVEVASLLARSILDEGVSDPLLGVAGLNPHAGEDGLMGDEDGRIVAPAVAALRAAGVRAEGPTPPDTLFIPRNLARYDGFVCMYHDQGHIPFKMLAFDRGVNTTLGLPIVRTSVDHGTAFDIAWKGVADIGSACEALRLAAALARARRAEPPAS